jgi:CRP/FNR family transcriptional regulator, cyclic AMP receptor protein
MTAQQPIEKALSEPVDEALLEHPAEALVNEAAQARKQNLSLREEAKRLKADAVGAQEASRRRAVSMGSRRSAGDGFVHVLHEDPELAGALPHRELRQLTEALLAPVISIRDSPWQPPEYDPDRIYGLLMLDGLLGRRVTLGAAAMIELLGHGDILRPWQEPPYAPIPARVDWLVLSPARLAVLDEPVTALIGRRPELTVTFAARLASRCHAATYLAAIGHIGRVEDRLLAILWHLAGNWGRVTPQGVRIPFRLTHEVLGELVGAKRPSVTIGLSTLRRQGDIAQTEDGRYVVTGSPPQWHRHP